MKAILVRNPMKNRWKWVKVEWHIIIEDRLVKSGEISKKTYGNEGNWLKVRWFSKKLYRNWLKLAKPGWQRVIIDYIRRICGMKAVLVRNPMKNRWK